MAEIDLESHEFKIPQKEIKLPADIHKWEKSEVKDTCTVVT